MKLKYLYLVITFIAVFKLNAQTPGVSIFYEQYTGDSREYIEYIPGNLPIIISAPHGGVKQSGQTIGGINYPDNDALLPDRSCGTNERDDNTDILIREIQAEIFALTGCYPHIIINNLHRSKLDPNREQNEATCGDANAIDHWNAWHDFIDQASTSVETNWGKGLYIDLHGQSHTVPRIEIGYNILSNQLNTGDLNSAANINRSTIKNLVSNNLNNHTHEELIRGDNSLGQLFQEQPAAFYNANVNQQCGVTSGYRAVPSNSNYGNDTCDDTRPLSNAYFNGNYYNNRRHGSGNGSGTNAGTNDGGGNIDGIMTEVNRRVRDLGTYNGNFYDNRAQTLVPFAKEYAAVVLDYIDIHYNNFASFNYPLNTYDVIDSDPSPTVTGIFGGVFFNDTGLVLNANTGVIDVSESIPGNHVVTYTVGSCGYFNDTFDIMITGPDTVDPSVPTNLTATNITFSTVDLSWTASTDNFGVVGYDIYQDGVFITNVSGTSHQVSGLLESTSYNFYIIAKDAANNSSQQSNTINITTLTPVPCTGNTVSTYPYNEDFETGIGLWSQTNDDDIDWTRDSNGTPSNDTGPSTGDGDVFYMYTEASVDGTGFPSKVANFVSPCFDFTGKDNIQFTYSYHMYGNFIGSLRLQISLDNGATYTTIDEYDTNLGNTWNQKTVNLSTYKNQTIKLRFNAITGSNTSSGWNSDIAIDNINVTADDSSSEPPVAQCQNINVQLDASGNATIVATDVDGGSTDDVAITNYTIDIDTFNCSNIGTPVDVTLTVIDGNNQTDTCSATVTVVDQIAPEFVNVPTNMTLTCGNNNPTWVDPSVTDNCAIGLTPTRTDTTGLNSGDVFPVGTTIISYTVNDGNGNSNTTSFTVDILDDTENPIASCQNITVQLDGTGNATITASQINNDSTDNCAIASITASQTTFTCANEGANNVTLTVIDANGNIDSCNTTVTIILQEQPILQCWETANYDNTTCLWEISGSQPEEPSSVNCWDDYQFNDSICNWENQGAEPEEPVEVNCWDDYQFDNDTESSTFCSWINLGSQPTEPIATNCWDNYQFNNSSCLWENQGSEPIEPTGLNASFISTTGATINWDDMPPLDYDLRYRQLGSPVWIDILDITTNTQVLTSLLELTDYEVEVRSKCSSSATSNYSTTLIFTTLDSNEDYCVSQSTNVNDEFISRVELNTIDNTSDAQFYSDFTDISTVLRKGTSYTITITPTWTSTVYSEGYSVWIDFNSDGDFTDAGEQVVAIEQTQNTSVSRTFNIPISALETKTRMRVAMKYNVTPNNPCETFQYGEVEDYTVILVGNNDLVYRNNIWTPYAPSVNTNSDNAFIINGVYTVTDDIKINNMTVCDGAGIIVEKVKSLTVNGDLKTGDNLILESDSNEYSSLIVNDLILGKAQYKRHVNSTGSTGGNDLIAAPVYGEPFDVFRANNSNILSNSANSLFLFGPFDKVTDTYVLYTDAETTPLKSGIGYRAASTNTNTFTFTGFVKMGEINTPIIISGPSNPEWNLIGNPYPSYIKLSDFLSANNSKFDNERSGIYGYDGDATNGWTIWNQAYSDANPNAKITPGQGFLVASANNLEQITFTPTMRSIGNGDDFILGRESNNVPISHLKLKLDNTTNFYHTDFYFTENASLGLDTHYDSGLFGVSPALSIYSHLVEGNMGRDYGIQSIGWTNLSNVSIPLGIHVSEGQQATISILETTLPQNIEVFLEDNLTNTFTSLNTTNYVFTANTNLTGTGRFFLSFAENTLSNSNFESNSIDIYTTTERKIILVKGELLDDTILTIYDLQGRRVKNKTLDTAQTINKIDVSSISNGVYIVSLKNKYQEKTEKVIIK
nr:GEVED domain-containing protein [uncultured Psychroserpens sp.]